MPLREGYVLLGLVGGLDIILTFSTCRGEESEWAEGRKLRVDQ